MRRTFGARSRALPEPSGAVAPAPQVTGLTILPRTEPRPTRLRRRHDVEPAVGPETSEAPATPEAVEAVEAVEAPQTPAPVVEPVVEPVSEPVEAPKRSLPGFLAALLPRQAGPVEPPAAEPVPGAPSAPVSPPHVPVPVPGALPDSPAPVPADEAAAIAQALDELSRLSAAREPAPDPQAPSAPVFFGGWMDHHAAAWDAVRPERD